jgi:transcriptional regulator with XRE-family HTH domain
MRVEKTIVIEVKNLGDRIRAARKADPRSLAVLSKAAGMSPANWYRIEEEQQTLPIETLRRMEKVLSKDFEVNL